jgi:hypothetical protein
MRKNPQPVERFKASIEPPAPWILADTVIARGFSPDQVAVELGAQVLGPDTDGASVEICPTAHLRLTMRGFVQLRMVLNQIANEMETANAAAMQATRPAQVH